MQTIMQTFSPPRLVKTFRHFDVFRCGFVLGGICRSVLHSEKLRGWGERIGRREKDGDENPVRL